MMLSSAPVFVDTYRANYAPRTALLPGVMDTISPDEHKYFYVFVRDIDTDTHVSNVMCTAYMLSLKTYWPLQICHTCQCNAFNKCVLFILILEGNKSSGSCLSG